MLAPILLIHQVVNMEKTNFFNHHLVDTGENYFEHFLFAFVTALWIMLTSVILICHAFFPFFFRLTASNSIRKINEVMQKRRDLLMARIDARSQDKKSAEDK